MAETRKKSTAKKSVEKNEKKEAAKHSTASTTTSSTNSGTTKRSWSSTKILDFIAYFAIIFIALATIMQLIFKHIDESISGTSQNIGQSLAYIICIWLGFYWVMRKIKNNLNKRNVWWLVGWIVATVVIVVIYIVTIIP